MGTLNSGEWSGGPGWLYLLLDSRSNKLSQNWRKVDEECERTTDIRPLAAF